MARQKPTDALTVREAARLTGLSTTAIINRIRSRELPARKVKSRGREGFSYTVRRADLRRIGLVGPQERPTVAGVVQQADRGFKDVLEALERLERRLAAVEVELRALRMHR